MTHILGKKKEQPKLGQSLIEVALALPILVMLLLGLLDFGRAFFTLVALHDAADEGASYASIRPNDLAGIQQRAAEASTSLIPVHMSDVSVVYPSSVTIGAPVTVTVDYFFTLYTPFVQSFFEDGELVLHGSATHAIISVR